MTNTKILVAVPECTTDDGEETCWAMFVGQTVTLDGKVDRNHYLWITKYADDEYVIEDSYGHNLAEPKIYKTLRGAKAQASKIADHQNEYGCFTD